MTVQEFRSDAKAQRKAMIFGGAMAVALLWLLSPSGCSLRKPAAAPRFVQQPVPTPALAARRVPPVGPPVSIPAPQPDASAPVSAFFGAWMGQGVIPERNGVCNLSLELGESPEGNGQVRAYTTLRCPPFMPLWLAAHPGQRLNPSDIYLKEMSTTESILTGSAVGESLLFSHVEETLGADSQGCALESLNARPFGNQRLAVKWQEGRCEGGELVLQRVRR